MSRLNTEDFAIGMSHLTLSDSIAVDSPSPLLSLPTEVRLKILQHVLASDATAILELEEEIGRDSQRNFIGLRRGVFLRHTPRSAQVLRTCQTLLIEGKTLLYSATTFILPRYTEIACLPVIFWRLQFGLIKHVVWNVASTQLRKDAHVMSGLDPICLPGLETLEIQVTAREWTLPIVGYPPNTIIPGSMARCHEWLLEWAVHILHTTPMFTRLVEERTVKWELMVRLETKETPLGSTEQLVDDIKTKRLKTEQHQRTPLNRWPNNLQQT